MTKVDKLRWKYNHDQKDSIHSEDADVHITFTRFGYETLCGLGAEGVSSNNTNFLQKTTKKVTCDNCLLIFNFCKTHSL